MMIFQKVDVLGQQIAVASQDGIVSIGNDKALEKVLDMPNGALEVAKQVKAFYKEQTGNVLEIETGSLHVEIVGHVYPDRIMKVLNDIKFFQFAEKGIEKVLTRTAVIDCGEEGKDGNRKIWDLLHQYAYDVVKKL